MKIAISILFAFVAMAVAAVPVLAQPVPPVSPQPAQPVLAQPAPPDREAIDSLLNPSVMDESESLLRFGLVRQDMGVLSEDGPARTLSFPFHNTGDVAVTITKVTTSCGCTAAVAEPSVVAAGADGVVTLTFNPRNRVGATEVFSFVYTDESSERPVCRLTLTGEVVESSPWSHYPFMIGDLRLKQKEVNFTFPQAGGRATERILCVNSGQKALALSAEGLPAYATFRTEPSVIEAGDEADLVISLEWDGDVPFAAFSFRVVGAAKRPGPDELIEVKIKTEMSGNSD